MYTNNEKSAIITSGFTITLYFLIAWGYAAFVGGGVKVFLIGLGVLLGARLFFGLLEMIGGIIAWRCYGKRILVEKCLGMLRANRFPQRYYAHDDFCNYLARVEDDDDTSASLKRAAGEWYRMLGIIEESGTLRGARAHKATEIALEIYSPRANAPHLNSSGLRAEARG